MPGLIRRYHAADEYAEFISTKPSSSSRRQTASSTHRDWQTAAHDAISSEASLWYEAVCPSAKEVQTVLQQFQTKSNFSQKEIFDYIYPLFIFALMFVLSLIALQPNSFAHHVLIAPAAHPKEMAIGLLALIGILLAGLAILRILIWAGAEVAMLAVTVEKKGPKLDGMGKNPPVTTTRGLLGGIFQ